MLTIRPFAYDDADYAVLYTIDSAVFPDLPMGLDFWKHIDATRGADLPYQRDLIVRDGEVVAWGEYGQNKWAYHPRKFFWNVFVHPDHEAADIRPLHFEHTLTALAGHDLLAITSAFDEARAPYIDFLLGRGFTVVMREPLSRLDVAAFDPAPFVSVAERVRAAGIRIRSVAELKAADPEWQRKLYALDWAIAQDVPNAEPPKQQSIEDWLATYWDSPAFREDAFFVALDGDRYVGSCMMWQDQVKPEQMNCGLAGVVRSHRRQGIVTALKV
ncbi:MAG: GNAT family N-acetyltransferase, partial [Anaerolineae bacterium]|nr:GNAT family N-acetyltransferase [Anaerolineae bacterium]